MGNKGASLIKDIGSNTLSKNNDKNNNDDNNDSDNDDNNTDFTNIDNSLANVTVVKEIPYNEKVFEEPLVRSCLGLQLHNIILHRSSLHYKYFNPNTISVNCELNSIPYKSRHSSKKPGEYSRSIGETSLCKYDLPNISIGNGFLTGTPIIGDAENCWPFDYYLLYQGDKISNEITFQFNSNCYTKYRNGNYSFHFHQPNNNFYFKSNKIMKPQECACDECINTYQTITDKFKLSMEKLVLDNTDIPKALVDTILSYCSYRDALVSVMGSIEYSNYCIEVVFIIGDSIATSATLYRGNCTDWAYMLSGFGNCLVAFR